MADFAQQQRDILSEGLHKPSEMGEMLRFASEAHRQRVIRKWGLDHADFDQRQINIALFQKSDDYLQVKVYKKRYS